MQEFLVFTCVLLLIHHANGVLPPPPSQLGPQVTDGVGMAPAPASLTVTATNEYGTYSEAALALYGLEMIVEPHRPTTLTATSSLVSGAGMGDGDGDGDAPRSAAPSFFVWRLVEIDMDDDDDDSAPVEARGEGVVVFEGQAGPQIPVELTKPGGVFRLTVEERLDPDGTGGNGAASVVVAARATLTISCKYVRRELRELTDADRKDVLDAMQVYYTVSTVEGKAKYGDGFVNYELLTAYHNANVSYACIYSSKGAYPQQQRGGGPRCSCVACVQARVIFLYDASEKARGPGVPRCSVSSHEVSSL